MQEKTWSGAVLLGLRPAAVKQVPEHLLNTLIQQAVTVDDGQQRTSFALGAASLLNKQPAGIQMFKGLSWCT